MSDIEFNAILYYADFLSLKHESQPVTDNCKYFFVYQTPINSAYILGLQPIYDENNKYLIQAYEDYMNIKNKFSDDAVMSFIDDICSLKACGQVDAERMLKHIHMYSTKIERKQAFKQYNLWKNNIKYSHKIVNEDGNIEKRDCTKYFKHAEIALEKQGIYNSSRLHGESTEGVTAE